MLFPNFEPRIQEEEREAGGWYDVLSSQTSLQTEGMPTTESEDAIKSDQASTEVPSQGQTLDDVDDPQLITKNELERRCDRNMTKNHGAKPKRPRNTVVKQGTEMESHMVKAEAMDKQPEDAKLNQQDCERKLNDTQAEVASTKEALQESRASFTGQPGTIKKLHADIKKLQDTVRSLRAANNDLQDMHVASQEELSRCRDDLFSLQPIPPATDSSIVQELEIVSQEVVYWIETEAAAFEKAHPEAEPEQIFSVGNNKDAANFLQQYPAAGEHLARYLVHRFFQANLFGRRHYYLVGLKKKTARLLKKAEHSMATFDPPRDAVSIAKWRSETLHALAAIKECKQIRNQRLQKLNTRLFKNLRATFPKLFASHDGLTRFYKQVLEPAAMVATTIGASISTYRYSMADISFHDWPPLGLRHMETHKMLNIKNGGYLKPNAPVVADEQGIMGKFIMPLEPGLYRKKGGGDEMTLRPEVYLVDLDHPVAKRSQCST